MKTNLVLRYQAILNKNWEWMSFTAHYVKNTMKLEIDNKSIILRNSID